MKEKINRNLKTILGIKRIGNTKHNIFRVATYLLMLDMLEGMQSILHIIFPLIP